MWSACCLVLLGTAVTSSDKLCVCVGGIVWVGRCSAWKGERGREAEALWGSSKRAVVDLKLRVCATGMRLHLCTATAQLSWATAISNARQLGQARFEQRLP